MPNIQFQFRRGTSNQWSNANTTLAAGEMGIESDTVRFKIGNGTSAWNSLSYGGIQGPTGPAGPGAVSWSTFRATQDVDMSSNALINWSRLSNTSGLNISGTDISGLSTINGVPATSLGAPSGWAQFPAVENVDMSRNTLSNVGRIINASGIATFPSYTFTSDLSTGIHFAGNSQLAFDTSGVQRMVIAPASTSISNPLYARMPVIETSGTSLTLESSNYGTYFYITNSGFNAATLPSSTATTDAGAFWSLRNATTSSLAITLTNTLNLTSPLIIPPNNTQSLVISSNTSNTILLL